MNIQELLTYGSRYGQRRSLGKGPIVNIEEDEPPDQGDASNLKESVSYAHPAGNR